MIAAVIAFSIASMISLLMVALWLHCWYRALWAKFLWTDARGTVEYVSIRSEEDSEGGRSFHPEVNYSYCVNGYQYAGTKLTYDVGVGYSDDFLRQVGVEDWRKGTLISLKYNARNPEQAVIFPGPPPGSWVSFAGSILTFALFFGLTLAGYSSL